LANEKGSVRFNFKNSDQYVFYSSIPGLNGWKFCLSVPMSYINEPVKDILIVLQILSAIFIIIKSIAALFIGSLIAHPISAVTDFIHNMSSGNFTGSIKKIYSKKRRNRLFNKSSTKNIWKIRRKS
jgi:HAMP domain-containing protein